MRVRGGFLVALIAVLVSVCAAVVVVTVRDRANERDARSAAALAHRLPAPAGAAASTECRGDGQVACWTSPQTAPPVARVVADSLRQAGARPQMHCHQAPTSPAPATTVAQWCQVSVLIGSHAVTVFVTPHHARAPSGPKLDGTLIDVSAS
jgi:hypothetical protein